MKTDMSFLIINHLIHLKMTTASEKSLGNIKTHITGLTAPFRKSCRLRDNVEKYCRDGQVTDDNMAYGYCMLGI